MPEKTVQIRLYNRSQGRYYYQTCALSEAIDLVSFGKGHYSGSLDDLKRAHRQELLGDFETEYLQSMSFSKRATLTMRLNKQIVIDVIQMAIMFSWKNWKIVGPVIIAGISTLFYWLKQQGII